MAGHLLVLFDGVCHLCNAGVDFVIARDPDAVFRFAALQGPAAQRLLGPLGQEPTSLGSVVLLEGGRVYTRSTAVLRIVGRLGWPWRLAVALWLIPAPLRDWVYGVVASRRYRWFGRRPSCRVPEPGVRARFLELDGEGGT
ncbi:MAG: thiol-disulfide oxidoreductase DCC family protein [Candidatus Latescibacterota bacterium]